MNTTTINNNVYSVRCLTRGEVRTIEAAPADDQPDLLVGLTLTEAIELDALPMPDFMELVAYAIKINGLDGAAIANAKKN